MSVEVRHDVRYGDRYTGGRYGPESPDARSNLYLVAVIHNSDGSEYHDRGYRLSRGIDSREYRLSHQDTVFEVDGEKDFYRDHVWVAVIDFACKTIVEMCADPEAEQWVVGDYTVRRAV